MNNVTELSTKNNDYKVVYDIFDETYERNFQAKDDVDACMLVDEYFEHYGELSDAEFENLSSVDIYEVTDDNYRSISRGPFMSVYLGDN